VEELLDALSSVRRAIRRSTDRPAFLASLTGAQVELVRLLRRQPGLTVAEAAAELRLAPNTVSTLVGQLVEAGFVERTVDENDRRVARLNLAPAVRKKVQAWRDRRIETIEAAVGRLSPDDRERIAAAVPALGRLSRELEQ
jgi:DNA-binding MarR family transcriptional regulator